MANKPLDRRTGLQTCIFAVMLSGNIERIWGKFVMMVLNLLRFLSIWCHSISIPCCLITRTPFILCLLKMKVTGSVNGVKHFYLTFFPLLYLVIIIQDESSSDHEETSLKSSDRIFGLQFRSLSFVSFHARLCFLLM